MPLTTPLALDDALPEVDALLAVVALLAVPLEVVLVLLLAVPVVERLPLLLDELGVGVVLSAGVGLTVKFVVLVAVPPELVTVIGPLPAPAGTMAKSRVSLTALKNAARPLKPTALVPANPLPDTVT